jgi:mannose-6-phosphate isomerase-like protein (cupin superfamily)
MKGYVGSIEKAALKNKTFRTVLYTAKNCQLVVMSLKPGEDIGEEVHNLDQLLRVEKGKGKTVLEGVEHRIKPGFAILVSGTRHNIINGPSGRMKLYALYAPPNHRDGLVHATKEDAEADEEHFDGKTTEIGLRRTPSRFKARPSCPLANL